MIKFIDHYDIQILGGYNITICLYSISLFPSETKIELLTFNSRKLLNAIQFTLQMWNLFWSSEVKLNTENLQA